MKIHVRRLQILRRRRIDSANKTSSPSPEERNSDYKDFLEKRNKFVDLLCDQDKQFDQYMFLLSSGVFGVSFSFMSSVVKFPNPHISWILGVAWMFVISSIFLSLGSYLINHFEYSKIIQEIDDNYIGAKKSLSTTEKNELEPTKKTKKLKFGEKANIVNLCLLGIGFIWLLLYVWLSLSRITLV